MAAYYQNIDELVVAPKAAKMATNLCFIYFFIFVILIFCGSCFFCFFFAKPRSARNTNRIQQLRKTAQYGAHHGKRSHELCAGRRQACTARVRSQTGCSCCSLQPTWRYVILINSIAHMPTALSLRDFYIRRIECFERADHELNEALGAALTSKIPEGTQVRP